MTNFEEVFESIKLATNTRTQIEIAEVLEIRQSSISDAKRRNSVPSDWYMKLFEEFGLNPDWLKKGTGPMYLRTEQGYTPVDAPAAIMAHEDAARYSGGDAKNTIVTVYSTQAAPSSQDISMVVGRLSVPQSYTIPGLYVIKTESTNMEPEIKKGAFVGIDTNTLRVTSGDLYAFNLPYEGVVLKYAFVDTQNGKLLLKSSNPAHPELSLSLEQYEDVVVGRVSWIMQKY